MAKNDEKIKELLELVEQGTKKVFESDTYKNYLLTMSKFHNYSFRNSLLILLQRPDATRVAGYTAWQQKFRRQVQRGEKGIQIIGYTPHNKEVEQAKRDSAGKLIYDENGKPVIETVIKQVPGFSPVYVYDVSQTKGEPLPILAAELNGNIANYEILQQAISNSSPIPIFFEQIAGNSKGYCTPEKIAIKENMSNTQTVKTMIHEITHSDLHILKKDLSIKDKTDQRTREVEAESTAFVVCSHYGIDTSDYSFPYIASWSSSKELDELHNSLERIQKQAGEIINRIDSHIEELQHNKNLQHDNLLAAPTQLAEKIVNYLEEVDFTQVPYHEQRITDFTGMLLSDKPQPIVDMLRERAYYFPQEKDDVNNLISEIIDYTKLGEISLQNETILTKPTLIAENITDYLEKVDYTQVSLHEQNVTDFANLLLYDNPQPIIDLLQEHISAYPKESSSINKLLLEVKEYSGLTEPTQNIPDRFIEPVEQSPFAHSGSRYMLDEETGKLISSKRNMKPPAEWTNREVALFAIETDMQLSGFVKDETLKAIENAGFSYTNGQLIELSAEHNRNHNEILDSIKFDNDIDLDKSKTREQLGFKDDIPKEKLSMKDRIVAAQTEAYKRNNAIEKKGPLQEKEEREI